MTATAVERPRRGIPGFAQMQRVGRSLMLPIASLPAAALLLRLGQPDMLGADGVAAHASWMQPVADVLAAAGNALFANLALLFAVGVAVGYAKKSDGSTALAAVIGYLVFKAVGDALSPQTWVLGPPAEGQDQALVDYGVLGGIVVGIVTALLYQRYYRIKLPPYLAFFGGRRFVPIVTAGASLLIAVVGAFVYPYFDTVFNDKIGGWVTGSTILGAFVFGTLNRLLVPLGLHHLLNSLPWFQFGSYTGQDGTVAHGDIFRFLAGDPTAGTFLTGFFPIMMFALPAAALAIIHTAKPENRKVIAGVMGSAALVSIVTGVTEPLEFSFVFVAYPLYAIHAVLTGTSLALVNALGIRDGFGFSAGIIDYLLNFRIAEMPLLLIPIGLGYAVVYYVLFRWVITRWNLRTPGREDDPSAVGLDPTADQDADRSAGDGTRGAAAAGDDDASVTAGTRADGGPGSAGPEPTR
ncbi:PTS transporter subunit EIIC [Cellulomonas sp. PhB143]|uniref:PTS transporter subunit EIIC n=1 Tax=Cellulomonas sp. PhB143 TaxID=2485186 RepID=UPI000F4A21B5|nr:PTS transporter subunit EIIC [Cellulomonas sp. PhB143]ROS77064.1 PTS system N-acetylglucosamine-specific IIC component (Glc family) [Cellulomonas sp. PhB143]